MRRLGETRLPTSFGNFQMIAYDSGFKDFPHIVLRNAVRNDLGYEEIRVHSECMTGDVFGSARCDCGEQLNFALERFGKYGGSVLYLRQEGRGIGLINKIKAYNLQDEGLDTLQANLALGLHADDRDYGPAIEILNDLDIKRIKILTNNPEKMSAFDGTDIELLGRVPIEIDPHSENEGYLRTKKLDMGHLISKV